MSELTGYLDGNRLDIDRGAVRHSDGLDHHFDRFADNPDLMLRAPQSGLEPRWDNAAPTIPSDTLARSLSMGVKRGMDIAGAMIGLLLLGPLMLIVSLIVKMTDKGPVLFRQNRVGLNGTTFSLLKFRSMYSDLCDPSGVRQTVLQDARITPIGRFIRRTSIDELPQLFNVLKGDMSLVGPRPHVAGMIAAGVPYEILSDHYGFRHLMRPGITGWAQCNSLRGPTVDERAALARVGHDIAYIQHFSLLLDLRILVRTIVRELLSKTAH